MNWRLPVLIAMLCLFQLRVLQGQACAGMYEDGMILRGDANNDSVLDHSDLVVIGNIIYGGTQVCNYDSSDVNDDGALNTTDISRLSSYFYQGGAPPAAPFPIGGCDTTADIVDTCSSKDSTDPQWWLTFSVDDVFIEDVGPDPDWGPDHWDDTFYGKSGTDGVQITAENWQIEDCDKDPTSAYFVIQWIMSDAAGITPRAMRSCALLRVSITGLQEFLLAAPCGCKYQGETNTFEITNWEDSLSVIWLLPNGNLGIFGGATWDNSNMLNDLSQTYTYAHNANQLECVDGVPAGFQCASGSPQSCPIGSSPPPWYKSNGGLYPNLFPVTEVWKDSSIYNVNLWGPCATFRVQALEYDIAWAWSAPPDDDLAWDPTCWPQNGCWGEMITHIPQNAQFPHSYRVNPLAQRYVWSTQ